MRRNLLARYLHYPVIIAVTLLAASLAFGALVRWLSYSQTVDALEQSARLAQAHILAAPSVATDRLCKQLGTARLRLTVIRLDGVVLGDSEADPAMMENHLDREELLAARQGRTGVATRLSASVGRRTIYVALPAVAFGDQSLVVRAAAAERDLHRELADVYLQIAVSAAILLAAISALTLLVERRMIDPIAALQRATAAYAAGELEHALHISRPPDLKAVADSLNRMAAALRQRMAEVTAQRDQLQAMLAGMVEGIVVLDRHLTIREINPSALRLAGRGTRPTHGATLLEVFRSTQLHELASQALATAGPVEGTVAFPGLDERTLQVHVSPLSGAEGGILLVLNDITRLQELERVRRDFVANVSHELKTPITAVKGALETLTRDVLQEDPAAAGRFLEVATRHSDRLASIVDDLLSLSRLEQQGATLDKEDCALEEVARGAMQVCQVKAAARGIRLELQAEEGLRAAVNPQLLEQALSNLIDNAIKYSNPGSTVSLHLRRRAEGVTLAVQDRGIGIPRQDLSRVFERFYRVDKARSRELGGTGLGLAIVKHIVLAHGGTVQGESELGAGSTFTILLPLH